LESFRRLKPFETPGDIRQRAPASIIGDRSVTLDGFGS
jgi:hypothetical protein